MSEVPAVYDAKPGDLRTPLVLTIVDIARICHEANRALCIANNDHSQMSWESAPEWQIDSCVAGVRFVLMNPDTTPDAQHKHWMDVKSIDGWKYGPDKNPETKEHPCMQPWSELPETQRVKDVLFGSIVRTLGGYVIWPA